MRDENCIFCKIIAGEIPSNTIYEDDEFKVVLDVSPASKGHALILPKNHYADLYEIDEDVAADAMKLAKKLAIHMTDVLKCDGFNLVQNNHEVAGQTVFHFHMQLSTNPTLHPVLQTSLQFQVLQKYAAIFLRQ
jgi:histidine triad (HIT) family protein